MAVVLRRDVDSLLADGPSGRKVLDDYARAVEIMRGLDDDDDRAPTNPLGWRYQAAIHGTPLDPPPGSAWATCHHNGWFFLPWHRAYLWRFERIVQTHLDDPSWRVPYWDYTKPDEDSRRIPAPFLDTGSPLYTEMRHPQRNRPDGKPLRPELISETLKTLDRAVFSDRPSDTVDVTFGGEETERTPLGGGRNARGGVESWPHGPVHSDIGGMRPDGRPFGWMASFDTAALDPLFWLHHSNIDRLWEVWRQGGAPLPEGSSTWMDHSFTLFDVDGSPIDVAVRQLLRTADLGYEYESIAPPGAGQPQPQPFAAEDGGAAMGKPQLVGATSDVDMTQARTVSVALEAPQRAPGFDADDAGPERWLVRIENMRATALPSTTVAVYLNLPDGADPAEHPDRRAALISLFGVLEATEGRAEHGDSGITDVVDVTDVVERLSTANDWDPATVRVTLAPIGDDDEVTAGGDLRAGRISVYRS